jgi:hypothetical protein
VEIGNLSGSPKDHLLNLQGFQEILNEPFHIVKIDSPLGRGPMRLSFEPRCQTGQELGLVRQPLSFRRQEDPL